MLCSVAPGLRSITYCVSRPTHSAQAVKVIFPLIPPHLATARIPARRQEGRRHLLRSAQGPVSGDREIRGDQMYEEHLQVYRAGQTDLKLLLRTCELRSRSSFASAALARRISARCMLSS